MVGAEHGRFNQAGDLAPRTSAYGQALRRAAAFLIGNPMPIGNEGDIGFRGFVGSVVVRPSRVMPVVAFADFGGDLPLSAQPILNVPSGVRG